MFRKACVTLILGLLKKPDMMMISLAYVFMTDLWGRVVIAFVAFIIKIGLA